MVLKLGSGTGSMTNHLYSRMVKGQPEPRIGMGATILNWTDRDAATIIAVETDKQGRTIITIQEDDAKRTDNNGFGGMQEYTYTQNPNAPKQMYRFEEGHGWRAVKHNAKGRVVLSHRGGGLRIGEREKYVDPSF